MQDDWHQGIDV